MIFFVGSEDLNLFTFRCQQLLPILYNQYLLTTFFFVDLPRIAEAHPKMNFVNVFKLFILLIFSFKL